MLKCYVDDSGSDIQEDGLFVLAGYIMEEARWEDFADQWDAQLKRNPPVAYCRMANAEGGGGPFVGMDSVIRKMKVKELATVISDCHPTAVACSIGWKQYNEIVKGKISKELDNPYALLFFQIMRTNSELQIEFNKVHPFGLKPVDFIFDDQGPVIESQCLQWYLALRDRLPEPHRTMLGNTPQFKDDRELTPLQAADMLAWHIRRDFKYPDEQREVLGMINPAGVFEREISDDNLRELVAAFNP
jgi:hypothetical protein